jgi:hypothetical protein
MRFIVSNQAHSTPPPREPGFAPESMREHHYQACLYEVNRKSDVIGIIHRGEPIGAVGKRKDY